MELGFPTTFAGLGLGLGLFAFATWRARQPRDPLKPRMVDYHLVQMVAVVGVLLMAAHLVTLVMGQPLLAGTP